MSNTQNTIVLAEDVPVLELISSHGNLVRSTGGLIPAGTVVAIYQQNGGAPHMNESLNQYVNTVIAEWDDDNGVSHLSMVDPGTIIVQPPLRDKGFFAI